MYRTKIQQTVFLRIKRELCRRYIKVYYVPHKNTYIQQSVFLRIKIELCRRYIILLTLFKVTVFSESKITPSYQRRFRHIFVAFLENLIFSIPLQQSLIFPSFRKITDIRFRTLLKSKMHKSSQTSSTPLKYGTFIYDVRFQGKVQSLTLAIVFELIYS